MNKIEIFVDKSLPFKKWRKNEKEFFCKDIEKLLNNGEEKNKVVSMVKNLRDQGWEVE